MAEEENAPEPEKEKKKKPMILLSRDIVLRRLNMRRGETKGESPMITLKEVFEEAPDKSRFVGDTMFWKFFEDIDINRIYHTDSVEYRNLRIMFVETVFFIILLLVFSIYVYSLQSQQVFEARSEQKLYWSGCAGVLAGATCQIQKVDNIEPFWRWMETDLIDLAFTEYTTTKTVAEIEIANGNNEFEFYYTPRFIGSAQNNVLLGAIRLRQLRVPKNTGCEVSSLVSHIYPNCFAPYSESVKDTEGFAPRFVPTYLADAFVYADVEETQQVSILGSMAPYSGGGYYADMPANKSDSLEMIKDLRENEWVGEPTRAVIVELTTLNINVNVIINTRIVFEFGPTGSVLAEVNSYAAQVFFFTPTTDGDGGNVYTLQIVLLVLFFFFALQVLSLMYKSMRNSLGNSPLQFFKKATCRRRLGFCVQTIFNYFGYGWNLVDLGILVLFSMHIATRFSIYSTMAAQIEFNPKVIGNPEMFMPFSKVFAAIRQSNQFLAVLALIMWVKTYKYLCMFNAFRLLVRILEQAAQELIFYCFMLLVVFFGFAMAFFIGFGSTIPSFSTPAGSFLVLFFLLLDGNGVVLDEKWFDQGAEELMPFVFFGYIAVMYFVLLNIFVAVVLDCYALSKYNKPGKATDDGEEKPNPMFVWMKTYFFAGLGISLVRDKAEQNLKSEDLSIVLELLPGIVRRKYIEKKRKMQRVANKSFTGLELFPEDAMVEAGATGSDWMLPSTRTDMEKMSSASFQKPITVYGVPQMMMQKEVSRAQLQRLMDEDETLPLLLGSDRAIDVIRRFKQGTGDAGTPDFAEMAGDEVSQVRQLQGQVFGKVDELEKINTDDEVPNVPEIRNLTEEMSGAVTDVRNQFRIQLTGIIEATAVLFEHLVELTSGIDNVRTHHEQVMDVVRQNYAEDPF